MMKKAGLTGFCQPVKTSLQAFFGACVIVIFESLVLDANAGVPGQVLYAVLI
ncbi:MAG: hypothetical protein IIC79_05950 [Chloroflexi bacterium]|nr:hypothetical protein [Chloroflexota bacterium]